MEELLLIVWAWLTLAIFAALTSVILRTFVQLVGQLLAQLPQITPNNQRTVHRFAQGNVGVEKILFLSLIISGIVCFLFWASLH